MDAVVNLAFNHDFSRFAQNGEDERKAIEALGSALEPGKLLVVTSGTGMASGGPGHVRTESDPPASAAMIPRQPEETAKGAAERGVHVAIVRLSQVHDPRKQGLVPLLERADAQDTGVAADRAGADRGFGEYAVLTATLDGRLVEVSYESAGIFLTAIVERDFNGDLRGK
jgi:hypothetical protein